jgi:hypothetical protein
LSWTRIPLLRLATMSASRCNASLKVNRCPLRSYTVWTMLTRLGLADVERAYVHVDYENDHDPKEEHKPLYEVTAKRSIKQRVKELLSRSKKDEEA